MSARRAVLWCASLALVAAPCAIQRPRAGASLTERVLGPVAGLAASWEWVRADAALRRERFELAYTRAERALALAPSSPDGWLFLARHFAFQRANPQREPDARARRQWVQAAFDVLERGERHAAAGGELSFERGLILLEWAEIAELPNVPESERPWPGDARSIYGQAASAFERAAELGHAHGAEYAILAREHERGLVEHPR